MIKVSEAFQKAIVGSHRLTELMAVVDLSDPDKVWLPVTSSGEAPWSKPEQLHNYELNAPPRYVTGERNRCLLGGGFDIFPDGYQVPGAEMGDCLDVLSGPDGSYPTPYPWVQENFENVGVLQTFSIFFSEDILDGVGGDFTVEVFSGSQVFFTQEVVHNTAHQVQFKGFTVYDPTAIRITVKRWSLPSRYVRIVEIVQGLFERWDMDMFRSFQATLQGQFSCLTVPYGSITAEINNVDRRFEPRRPDSIFKSIKERQGISFYIRCWTENGWEAVQLGLFYMAPGGYEESENAPTIKWYLPDIIGLIAERNFQPPAELPTTLEGWLESIVSQLGESFSRRYRVDPDYADLPVIAADGDAVTGKKCGDLLKWACQATGTWFRARQQDGALTAEPLWNEGNTYTLDAVYNYPNMNENTSLAGLIFKLTDGTVLNIPGNSTSAQENPTVINPFIHTADQARAAARLILAQYGGNKYETVGRGDPSSEIGDVATLVLDESNATTARVMSQTFVFRDGVLRDCRSTFLQADGSCLYMDYEIITESGTWQAKEGVTNIRYVIGQGGQGGGYGQDGYVTPSGNLAGQGSAAGEGEPGADGSGGAVVYGTASINPQQIFTVNIGQGGAAATKAGVPGGMGGHTTFGPYSSEGGKVYPNGYTDIANGLSFGRTGVEAPLPGTGDGGKGGAGGPPGAGYWKQAFWPDGRPRGWDWIETTPPGKGKPGAAGGSGFVLVFWDKP